MSVITLSAAEFDADDVIDQIKALRLSGMPMEQIAKEVAGELKHQRAASTFLPSRLS